MEKISHRIDQFLKQLLGPSRVQFLLGAFLVCQISMFLYNVCVPGFYDRLGSVRGRDLLQFYLSGRIVADHESSRLYDHEFFQEKQNEIIPFDESYQEVHCRYFSLYPPTMALIFSPLAKMPYDNFAILGWIWTVVGYCVGAKWVVRDLHPPEKWRLAAILGVLAFYPAIVMLWNCQFSWVWLLGFLGGFWLRRLGRDFLAGISLSVLTLKPHFAVAATVWLLMKNAWRTLAGLIVGFVLQAIIVSSILGPQIWQQYFVGARIYSKLNLIYDFTAEYQQAVLGSMQNLLGPGHLGLAQVIYSIVLVVVLILTYRVIASRGKVCRIEVGEQNVAQNSDRDAPTANVAESRSVKDDHRLEESAVILMVLLCLPHLLIYDLVLLLIPMGHLFGLHRDRPDLFPAWPPIVLYILTMIAPVYPVIPGFSLIPYAMILIQIMLAKRSSLVSSHGGIR